MAEAANTTALATTENDLDEAVALKDNPIFRQAAVMVGIAASVALGVAVVLWSQAPTYEPLYGNLSDQDATQILEALQKAGSEYKVDETTGMIMVPAGMVKELRMQLASDGLPNSDGLGFELMQQDMGFGTSRLVENARHLQSMQGELARTIITIGAIKNARVHLAIPKQSVFVRKRKKPSASVTLQLHPGRTLEKQQVAAITHLVASSVPELETSRVTVVDHKGNLLSEEDADRNIKHSSSQFEFSRKVEDHYRERIENLLAPIVGADAVRAQVTAEMDFTVTEQTQERFNPDQPALRSEQLNEEQSRLRANQGVPGALTNQPPATGQAPEVAGGNGGAEGEPLNSSRQSTRNYELDRVVSHSRMSPSALRRLSVAVVVDNVLVPAVGEGAQPTTRERSPEEMERLTQLVREAIGFDARRGDSLKVINSAFLPPEQLAELPEPPIWEQAWFIDLVKQVGGLLIVLLLVFGVIKPAMKRLTATHAELEAMDAEAAAAAAGGEGASVEGPLGPDGQPLAEGGDGLMLGHDEQEDLIKLPGGGEYENIMDAARQLVDEDPKRVAQLVKLWIAEDAA